MIDIYDEVGYIKEVLKNGLSEKWQRDATLLVRYYKSQGEKKSVVKQKIREKCELSPNVPYNPYTTFTKLNKLVDNAWRDDVQLRQIQEIRFPKKVLEYFMGLQDYKISQEVIDQEKEKRSIHLKERPLTLPRIKYLFTLYVWTLVQSNYLERPNVHYLKKYQKRFKDDADLKPSFSMQKERDLLCDLGFLYMNFALGVIPTFMDTEKELFASSIEGLSDDQIITLKGDDLYHCGYWLEKQIMGSFVCKNCGKEFAHYSKQKNEWKRIYCKECANLLRKRPSPQANKLRKRVCLQCGKEFSVHIHDTASKYCKKCKRLREK